VAGKNKPRSAAARKGWDTRRRNLRSAAARKGWKTRRRKQRKQPQPPSDREYDLCLKRDRQSLYNRVVKDYFELDRIYKNRMAFRRVQVFLVTDEGSAGEMKRTFRGDFAPLKRFLGLAGKRRGEHYPTFSRDDFCQYEKQVLIGEEMASGKIGKVSKRYNIAPPIDVESNE
jgi:hypothetical protein